MNIMMEPLGWPLGMEVEAPEVWCLATPKHGDHIRVCRMDGLYYHHGIYVAEDEVIHFTGDDDDSVLDWSKARVIRTSLERFLSGGTVEIKEYNEEELADLYPVEGIVNYARACLGDDGYNILFNNCEHFANACTLGKYRSRQVERVLGGNMGIWGSIKSFFGFGSSSGGSRSTSNYNYEPDKVKIAEIERDMKLKLADKEEERITANSEEYNTKKLPQLLDLLGKYEQGTPQHEIYMAQINDDRVRQNQFVVQQMEQVRERQNVVLNSFLSTKEKIIE